MTKAEKKNCIKKHEKCKLKQIKISSVRFIVMFVTAVCVLFLIKLRWPKKNNFFDTNTYFSDHKTFLDYMHVFS